MERLERKAISAVIVQIVYRDYKALKEIAVLMVRPDNLVFEGHQENEVFLEKLERMVCQV